MTDPLVVVAAVIEREGWILACRRGPGKIAAGLWEFPGGKVEPGEQPEQALVREIREELDIDIAIEGHLTTDDTVAPDRTVRLICYRASLVGPGPVASTDHDRMVWLEPSSLTTLEWAAPDLPAVRLLTGE